MQQHSVLRAAVRHEGNGLRDLPCCAVDVRARRVRVLVARGAEESDEGKNQNKCVTYESSFFLLVCLFVVARRTRVGVTRALRCNKKKKGVA